MKILRSQDKIDLVIKLQSIISQRKSLELQEKGLKEEVKELMGEDSELRADYLLVMRREVSRTDLDKEKIKEVLGEDLEKFQKTTTYETLTIKAA